MFLISWAALLTIDIFRCASISCTGQLESGTETEDQPFVCSLAICLVFYTKISRCEKPWGILGLYDHLTGIRVDIEWAEDGAWRRANGQP